MKNLQVNDRSIHDPYQPSPAVESTGKSRYRIDAEYSTYSTVPTR
jgi:hypothetical protein